MGDTVATTENGDKRIRRAINDIAAAASSIDDICDLINDNIAYLIVTALVADAIALGARLNIFVLQYKEQLECISIDQ